MTVDISNKSYAIAELHHYSKEYFNENIASKIIGKDGKWDDESGLQSCAMRASIALSYAGVHWPIINNSWKLKDTSVYFPSQAGDYPNLLANRETVKKVEDIKGRKGVIYFGGAFASATGHVTLWDGSKCHFNDQYWTQPNIYFWEMA